MTELRTAYEGQAADWARGPSPLYDALALRIVQPFASRVRGATVLDAGAGTGAVCRALVRVGASAVALDSSADMLSHIGGAALLAVVGDLCSPPFLDGTFDAAVSAFAISHVDTPGLALSELRRVVRPGGLIVAAVFAAEPSNLSKDVIHTVAAQYGYEPPAWYVHLKTRTEPLSNTPDLLRACSLAAGLQEVVVDEVVVDSVLTAPDQVVEYRAGMAHLAPFVRSLNEGERERFRRDAVNAVSHGGQPVRPRILIMSSRAPA